MVESEDGEEASPPTPQRVMLRALVLATLSCRSSLEHSEPAPDRDRFFEHLVAWATTPALQAEFEDAEWGRLTCPLGDLPERESINTGWRTEGLGVLSWALGKYELPDYESLCDGPDAGNPLGFLSDEAWAQVATARLRSEEELEFFADRMVALHWRLREYSRHPIAIDFETYAVSCSWSAMSLDGLILVERDLAIGGRPLARTTEPAWRRVLSIAQERHQAANWLLGTKVLYSEVTCDT